MNDTDKLVAAIFAAQMCSEPGNKHADFLAQYETFLTMMHEREKAGGMAAWEKLGGKE